MKRNEKKKQMNRRREHILSTFPTNPLSYDKRNWHKVVFAFSPELYLLSSILLSLQFHKKHNRWAGDGKK